MLFDFQKPFTFDRVIRILITLGIFYGIFKLLEVLQSALVPFAIALLLAYLLNPLVDFLKVKARLKNHALSVITSLILVTGFLVGILAILIPLIRKEVSTMGKLLQAYADEHAHKLPDYLPQSFSEIFQEVATNEELQNLFSSEQVGSVAQNLLPEVWSIFSGSMQVLLGLFGIVTVLLYLVFILLDYDKLTGNWQMLIPPTYRDPVTTLFGDFKQGMNTYFRAQATVAAIVGVLFAIGFSIIGLPLGILLGLFIGLLNMVPYLQLVAIVPALFLALLQSLETGTPFWFIMLMILIVFVVVQGIQEVLLVPKIMGNVTGLNPAIILLSLSIWGSLLGVLGMLIALPVSSLLLAYYQRYLKQVEQQQATSEGSS